MNIKKITYILASFCLGLLLLAVLMRVVDTFNVSEFFQELKQSNLLFIGLIIVSTLFHFLITSQKWSLVTKALVPDVNFKGGFFFYTAVNGLVCQFLPMQISMVTVRSLALRFHQQIPISKGAVSSLYDQFFDFLIPSIFLIPAILVIFDVIDKTEGLILSIVGILISVCLIIIGCQYSATIVRFGNQLPLARWIIPKVSKITDNHLSSSLFQTAFIIKMFVLSVVRYLNLVLRMYLFALAANLNIPLLPIVFTMPIVLLSFVINITPGNLGIAEWGWVGVLGMFGINSTIAFKFALFSRVLSIITLALINAVLLLSVRFIFLNSSQKVGTQFKTLSE